MGFSPRGAFLSGFVLATSPRYWILARRCISDMTLCFFITCAMTFYFEARRDPQNTKVFYFLLFVLSLSCAFMSKGLVGLAIPLASLAAWRVLTTKPSLQDFMLLFAGGVLCLLPFVIWLLYLYGALGGDAVYQMVWTQNFGRFTGDFAAHLKPFYFYVTVFPVQFLPWTLFLPLGVMQHLSGIPAGNKDNHSRFVFSWFIGTFILLSLSASKRGIYLIPLYPAAALLVGTTLGAILEGKSAPGRQYRIAFLILLALTVFAGPGFFGMGIYFKQPFVTYALLSLLVFCPALWAVLRFRKGDTAGSLKITLAALGLSFIVVGWWSYPLFTRDDSFTPLFQKCDQLQAEGFRISLYEPRETLRGAAVFYLKKCMPELYGEQKLREFLDTEEKGVLLCEKKRIKNNAGQFDVGETFKVSRRKYVLVKKGHPEQKEE
jgi:4-amino-4-deoxy-L-arabinose transferase-like glycosyltransferase